MLFREPNLAVGDSLLVKKGNPLKLHSYEGIATPSRCSSSARPFSPSPI